MKNINEVAIKVCETLKYLNKIPSGIFQIEENHLSSFCDVYKDITKSGGSYGSNSNKLFARRLAGLNLLKWNFMLGAKFNDIKAGAVYLISNPVFPDHYKVGMTLDVYDRLSSYQTYDPYRRFEIFKQSFVIDRRAKEKQILVHPDVFNESGEWILKENAIKIFFKITGV